jgi:flavin reductase (DIM6/NTAB) family NADH-FMN oxidoreductase RutF/rubredoxin
MNPHALHKLSYGIYVLSAMDQNMAYGCIINTAFQITSKPARIAVSCNRDNFTHQKILASGCFGLTVLSEQCESAVIGVLGYKSGRDTNKFAGLDWVSGPGLGVPLLPKMGMATFECKVVDKLEVGTHTLFIGEIAEAEITNASAAEMTYRFYHQVLKGVAPKNAPTYIESPDLQKSGELWLCPVCGFEYDPALGHEDFPPGTAFADLPEDWLCPVCGVDKESFLKG